MPPSLSFTPSIPIPPFPSSFISPTLRVCPPQTPFNPQWSRPCPPKIPKPQLALARPTDLELLFRLSIAVTVGAIIGTERRAAAANAGIRTLSLVSLGAAIFSLTSLAGLGGDPSRMGAAISTGIGFLGSGAINGDRARSRRQLVTAASIWVAAALGVAAASGLHGLALMGAAITVWVLRWRMMAKLLGGWIGSLKDLRKDDRDD